MIEGLPESLAHYLMGTTVARRHPAWLEVDSLGRVCGVGGDLGAYGLEALQLGDEAEDAAPYLTGLLPTERHLILPMVTLSDSRVADVHLVSGDPNTAVLLLDCTEDARAQRNLQQAALEGRLAAERAIDPAFADAVAGLGILTLVRWGPREFGLLGTRPPWSRPFVPVTGRFDPAEIFPFLESFLPDAEGLWDAGQPGSISSGTWVETSGDRNLNLEAVAIIADRSLPVLAIQHLGVEAERHQELVQRARNQALVHERMRREIEKKEILLHCIVHDLKTPLTTLTSSLFLLSTGKLSDEEAKSTLELGLSQSRRQERLIMTILEVFRQDLASDEAAEATCHLAEVVEQELVALRPAYTMARRRLQSDIDCPPGEPLTVRGEAGRVGRVVANLLDNALRHTPTDGLVVVRVQSKGGFGRVTVENEGDEVPESFRRYLFQRFAQASGRAGGSGLGLFYCRITVERWGGSIHYEVRPQGGSRFVFQLPRVSAEGKP